MTILKDIKTGESREVHPYAYCESGVTHIINPDHYPNDRYAEKTDKGYKCGNCIDLEIQRKIVKVTPNTQCAREILAEEERQVKHWNKHAARLERIFGKGALPYKKNRFVS